MLYRRGDVIAVPYDYSDLSGSKIRPAVIISSDAYNVAQRDVIAAGISSQVAKAGAYDHILTNWSAAGLRYPSLIRSKLLTIEQNLIRRTVGHLTADDLFAFQLKLLSFLLNETAIADSFLTRIDAARLPPELTQKLTEKMLRATVILAERRTPGINLERLRVLLEPPTKK